MPMDAYDELRVQEEMDHYEVASSPECTTEAWMRHQRHCSVCHEEALLRTIAQRFKL